MIIERKYYTSEYPKIGNVKFLGQALFVQAIGVRLRQQPVTKEYYLDLDKKFFIAKDGKGNLINGKLVGEYL